MNISELKDIIRNKGVVGAGGAGFPSYAKLDSRTEIILLNCAECEPLLKLHRQLLKKNSYEIMKCLQMVADIVGAKETIISLKKKYKTTIASLESHLDEFPNMRIHKLESMYPMGDEVIQIYEATGRVIPPGGIPIQAGVTVFNVETIYNISRAINEHKPVTEKYISVVGAVEEPVTLRVPIGIKFEDVVAFAGGSTVKNPVYLIGGPMMGMIQPKDSSVTKTTNAILVLPKDHTLILRRHRTSSIDLKRAASVCCQCRACTDLCPRYLLGHPVEPHKFMRSASNKDFHDLSVFLNSYFCCSCGICELYACPQGLAPRSLIADYKNGLRKAGVKPPQNIDVSEVLTEREYRKVPEERLKARIDVLKYEAEAPLVDESVYCRQVVILLNQHIGAPAIPVVSENDEVTAGDLIAKPADGLSVAIHSSVTGIVVNVTAGAITIKHVK